MNCYEIIPHCLYEPEDSVQFSGAIQHQLQTKTIVETKPFPHGRIPQNQLSDFFQQIVGGDSLSAMRNSSNAQTAR